MLITTFIIYLILVLVVGIIAERYSSKSEAGYYLGDRKFGPLSTAISAGATDSSGWQFIGAAGYAYAYGVSSMWMLPGLILGYFINWMVIGPRFQKYGKKYNVLSLADYFEKRFNDKSHVLKLTASVIIAIFFIAYMASQLSAAGITFNTVLNLNFETSVVISVVFVLAYTILGGYRAVIWTDLTQGLIMLGVFLIFPTVMIFQLGGIGDFFRTVGEIDPILLSSTGGEVGAAGFGVIMGLFGIGLGEPGQPHLMQRFLTAKNSKAIHQGTYISVLWCIIVVMGSNLIGLIGRILLPDLNNPEYVFPDMAMSMLPAVVGGIVIAAIFAAIQSTYSSQLMVATQSIANDILKSVSKKEYTDKQHVNIGRVVMLVLSVIATGIAVLNLESVFSLTLYAWAGLGASFGPLLIMSLYSKKITITKQGALSGMIVGTIVTIVWKNLPYSAYLYEIIPGLISSTLIILIVSKFTSNGITTNNNQNFNN